MPSREGTALIDVRVRLSIRRGHYDLQRSFQKLSHFSGVRLCLFQVNNNLGMTTQSPINILKCVACTLYIKSVKALPSTEFFMFCCDCRFRLPFVHSQIRSQRNRHLVSYRPATACSYITGHSSTFALWFDRLSNSLKRFRGTSITAFSGRNTLIYYWIVANVEKTLFLKDCRYFSHPVRGCLRPDCISVPGWDTCGFSSGA